jgi:uncharacterized protein YgiB involved in biofilm formation
MADTWSYDDPLRAGQRNVDVTTESYRRTYDCLDATARRRMLQTMAIDKACTSLLAQSPQALTQVECMKLEMMQLQAHVRQLQLFVKHRFHRNGPRSKL